MRIAILDLTAELPELLSGLPRASRLITDWLSPALPEANFAAYDISGGKDLPFLTEFDGCILSGSECGVYDTPPWMLPLRDFLKDLRVAKIPTFGICFGHQIMADTWGGVAQKSREGNVVGVREFALNGQAFNAYVWHQDQVTAPPNKAQVLSASSYCPIGMLAYEFPALSVQFHPEFTEASLCAMLERGRGHFISSEMVQDALESIRENPVDPALIREDVAAFFRKYLG